MSMRCFLNAKIHRAVITESRVDYEGSITIDKAILDLVGILPYEQVEIYNVSNGERLSTYAISGNTGDFCLNGAAALKGNVGDMIIIASYTWLDADEIPGHRPKIVLLGHGNKIRKFY